MVLSRRRIALFALMCFIKYALPAEYRLPRVPSSMDQIETKIVSPTSQQSPFLDWRNRRLDNATDKIICSMCDNDQLVPDVSPPYYPDEEQGLPPGLTCLDFDAMNMTQSECELLRTSFTSFCCVTPNSYECETKVKEKILNSYDTSSAPLQSGRENLNLTVHLDFFHIQEIDIKEGTAHMFIWLTLQWNDPRLAWNVTASENCVGKITARASLDAELSDIWVPDYDLMNQVIGVTGLTEAMAEVYSDGTVLWVRNGGIKAFCSFQGLNDIPYDKLECRFIFATWTNFDRISLILGGPSQTGFIAPNLNETGLRSYAEYTLIEDEVQTQYQVIQGRPLLTYDFFFSRATSYYVTKIIVPNIVFTFLSFGVYLLDLRIGERISYGMSVLLVNIAQDIVTQGLVPITEETLWINVLVNGSFYWILVSVVESVVIGWFFFLYEDRKDKSQKTRAKSQEHEDKSKEGQIPGEEKQQENSDGNNEEDRTELKSHSIRMAEKASQSFPYKDHPEDQPSASMPNMENREMFSEENKPALLSSSSKSQSFSGELEDGKIPLLTLRQKLMADTKKRSRFIKKIDHFFFMVIPTTYIIFLIVMFVTSGSW